MKATRNGNGRAVHEARSKAISAQVAKMTEARANPSAPTVRPEDILAHQLAGTLADLARARARIAMLEAEVERLLTQSDTKAE